MAQMGSMVDSLPEEFFENLLAANGQQQNISGKRLKCLARLAMKALKVWIAITDVAKIMLQRKLALSLSVIVLAVAMKYLGGC